MSDVKFAAERVAELKAKIIRAEEALDERNWTLAQIRDALTWPEKPAFIVAGIDAIVNGDKRD